MIARSAIRAVAAAGALLLAGCAAGFRAGVGEVNPTEPGGDRDGAATSTTAQLQQRVMDFSDRFVTATWQALDDYIATEPDVAKHVRAQRLKIALASASMTIAASPDPRANLLDMAVFVSAGRWAVERHWIPDVFGEKAAGLRRAYAELDGAMDEEVARVLTAAQRADLRDLLAAWKAANPTPPEVMDVRLRNLEGVELSRFQESSSARGLLASVRRLLGRVDQSLLYGERMMFYLERTPRVLSQQAELTVDRVAERFPIATVNPDFGSWLDFAHALPQQLGDALVAREAELRELLPEVRGSLESAERIAGSVQATVAATDTLTARLERLPFEAQDYRAALDRTTESLTQLNGIVLGLNRLLEEDATTAEPRAAQLARALDERAARVLDEAFWRAVTLLGLFFGGVILVLVVARLLFRPARRESPRA